MDDLVRERLRTAASMVALDDDLDRVASEVSARPGARRRATRRRMGAATTVLVGASASVAVWASTRDRVEVATGPASTADSAAPGTATTTESSASRDTTTADSTADGGPDETLQVIPASVPPPPLTVRSGSAVVALENGDVVVWGGEVPNHIDASEPALGDGAFWDASSRLWRPIDSGAPVSGHVLFAAPFAGDVIVVDVTGAIARLDVATGEWGLIAEGCPPNADCTVGPVAVVGDEVILPYAQAVDIETGAVRTTSDPPTYPFNGAVVGGDGELYLHGSVDEQGSAATLLRYDVAADTWSELPPPERADGWDGMFDGFGLVAGRPIVADWQGQKVAAYDAASQTWASFPALPQEAGLCLPQVLDVRGVITVELCGVLNVWLEEERRWAPLDEPLAWPVEGPLLYPTVLQVLDDGLLFGHGEFFDISDETWWKRPVTMEGLRVGPELGPIWNGTAADLVTGCSLIVRTQTDPMQVRVQREATTETDSSPESITWGSERGLYILACPDRDAYTATFESLDTIGERTVAVDITADLRVEAVDVDELERQATESVLAHVGPLVPSARVSWYGGPFEPGSGGDPGLQLYELGVPTPGDPSGPARVYRFHLAPEPGLFRVERVELQYVCETAVEIGATTCTQE